MKPSVKRKGESLKGNVRRISISLPIAVFRELDSMVTERGLRNRSRAISEMIADSALDRRRAEGDPVMAGVITLVYNESQGALASRLLKLERQSPGQVISSIHVQLEDDHRMQIIIVQGPVRVLEELAGKILRYKGVISCRLSLVEALVPWLHDDTQARAHPAPVR